MGRKSKALERRKEILEHFYDVILEVGFENASIARIAKRMDVNPSLLIHYFKTKEEMIKGLVDSLLKQHQQYFIAELDQIQDPMMRLTRVLDSTVAADHHEKRSPGPYYSCYALLFRDPEIRSRFKEAYQFLADSLTEELRRASDAGVIRVEDPIRAAKVIISLSEGLYFCRGIFDEQVPANEGSNMIKQYLEMTTPV